MSDAPIGPAEYTAPETDVDLLTNEDGTLTERGVQMAQAGLSGHPGLGVDPEAEGAQPFDTSNPQAEEEPAPAPASVPAAKKSAEAS